MSVRSEEIGSFCFKYDRSKKLKDLILASTDNAYLLSVNKKYSNNEYFGACSIFLVLNETPTIFKLFKCKDRGFTEELVDNRELYIEHVLKEPPKFKFRDKFNTNSSEVFIKQDVKLPKVNGRDFYVEYSFIDGRYLYTNFVFENPPAVYRGLYGSKNLERDTELYGIAIPMDSTPTYGDLLYLRDQAEISFSNVYHEVSTEYSLIEVLDYAQ